jgi:hypothetical protein
MTDVFLNGLLDAAVAEAAKFDEPTHEFVRIGFALFTSAISNLAPV